MFGQLSESRDALKAKEVEVKADKDAELRWPSGRIRPELRLRIVNTAAGEEAIEPPLALRYMSI